jgi:bacillithiol synthase
VSEAPRNTTMRLDAGPFLAPLARRLAAGEHADLLAPLRLIDPAVDSPPPSPALDDGAVARRRAALAVELGRRNRELGHPRAAELATRLADPATRVVVTGQQPGLLGGPLYALSKLLAAVRWAELLERDGCPALALFWLATEDHDFAEVAHCLMPLGEDGSLERLELPDDGRDLVPVGRRRLGEGVLAVLERLRGAAAGERQAEWVERLAGIYRPERTFGEAFAGLMVELLGERCPLFVDALDRGFKSVQRDVLRTLVERRDEVAAALDERDADIARRGLPHQVAPQPDSSPLFLLEGDPDGSEQRRRRLQWTPAEGAAGWTVRGGATRGTVDELLALLEDEPERVGPGALARPAVQDAMLGTAAFLVGPGELSYLIQASALYPVLGVAAPAVALRPQLLLLDERRQGHLAEMSARGLEPAVVLGPADELEAALARAAGDGPVERLGPAVMAAVDRLRAPAGEIDPQLDAAWEKTRAQVERALEAFGGRVRAARARSDDVLRQRIDALRRLCLPGGGLQERRVCVAWYPGLYGEGVARRLLEGMELSAGSIQLLDPAEESATPALTSEVAART